jgi:hypothetical protein
MPFTRIPRNSLPTGLGALVMTVSAAMSDNLVPVYCFGQSKNHVTSKIVPNSVRCRGPLDTFDRLG